MPFHLTNPALQNLAVPLVHLFPLRISHPFLCLTDSHDHTRLISSLPPVRSSLPPARLAIRRRRQCTGDRRVGGRQWQRQRDDSLLSPNSSARHCPSPSHLPRGAGRLQADVVAAASGDRGRALQRGYRWVVWRRHGAATRLHVGGAAASGGGGKALQRACRWTTRWRHGAAGGWRGGKRCCSATVGGRCGKGSQRQGDATAARRQGGAWRQHGVRAATGTEAGRRRQESGRQRRLVVIPFFLFSENVYRLLFAERGIGQKALDKQRFSP